MCLYKTALDDDNRTTTIINNKRRDKNKSTMQNMSGACDSNPTSSDMYNIVINSFKRRSRGWSASISELTLAMIYRGPGEPGRTLAGVRSRDVGAFGVDPARAGWRHALVDVHASTSGLHFLRGRGISGRAGARVVASRVRAHGVGATRRRLALVHVCVSGQGGVYGVDVIHNNIIIR